MTTMVQFLKFTPICGTYQKEKGWSVILEAGIPYATPENPNAVHSAKLNLTVSSELFEALMKNGCSFPIIWETE